jgi:hypothetical protein
MASTETSFRSDITSAPSGQAQGVQTGATISASAPALGVQKAIVAVHGIGDQHTYATIQAVVNQFSGFYPAAVPLGAFHENEGVIALKPPFPAGFAFAEVYWATIPREAAKDAYIIEEAKAWARTIVGRLKLRWKQTGESAQCGERDFDLMALILSEMIESIAILDRISFLAARAGLFTFDLRKMMEDYLGDVQVVVDFASLRTKILETFDRTMAAVHKAFPNAEIYIIAHSEGTVVSLLGLLKAYRDADPPPWSKRVRGIMTLGSPIDKHLVLWPDLFGEGAPLSGPDQRIEWHNYYDRGDPVGFALDDARDWLNAHGWNPVLDFRAEYDHGFSRYPYPGKAHIDYWNDATVFRHFIDNVIKRPRHDGSQSEPALSAASADATRKTAATAPTAPPKDKLGVQLVSYALPYVLVLAIMGIGAYFFYRAARGFIYPLEAEDISGMDVAKNVIAIALLLFGVTAASRIPRLTRLASWRAVGALLGIATAALYVWTQVDVADIPFLGRTIPSEVLVLGLTTVLIMIAYFAGSLFPHLGIKPLVIGGVIVCTIYLAARVIDAPVTGPLWPVATATIVLLYLWWLGALLFDLSFVWHLYIRNTRLQERIDSMIWSQPAQRAPEQVENGDILRI